MAKHTWSYLYNTFEKNTRKSNVKMLSIATDTFSKLQAQNQIQAVATILNTYEPVFQAYRTICIQYDIAAGNRQGNTLNVKLIFKDDLPEQLRKWEAIVRSFYVEDSPQEKAIFPNKREPFFKGTYEDRILSIDVLAKSLIADGNFASLVTEVQSFYNLLLTARDSQQQQEGMLGLMSKTREAQRQLMATELYAAMAMLMFHYKNNPEMVAGYFDLSLLRYRVKKKEQ